MSNEMHPPAGERPSEAGKRSLVQRALDAIFGYDFFISYTRRDGGKEYAEALARRLRGADFQIFFDSDEYAMGDDWKVEGKWALRRTSQLILVASPEALSSPAVVREVEIYSSLPRRRIIPIDFGGTIRNRDETKPVFKHLKSEILFIEEHPDRLGSEPSDLVVRKIRDGFNLKRQDKKRSRIFGIVALVLVVLTILASGEAWRAHIQQKAAETAQKTAEQRLHLATARQLEIFARTALDGNTTGDGLTKSVLLSTESIKQAWTPGAHSLLGRGLALLSRRPTMTWGKRGERLMALALSRVSGLLASEDEQGNVVVWNPATGQSVLPLSDSEHARVTYGAITFSPDGKWLVTNCGAEASVRDTATADWKIVARLPNEPMIVSIAFSPDGHLLATASLGIPSKVRLYETGNWDKILPPIDIGEIHALAFSSDSKSLITGDRIWDVTSTPATIADYRLPDSENVFANSIVVSKDGRFVAAAHGNIIFTWQAAGEDDVQPNRMKPPGMNQGMNRPWKRIEQLQANEPYVLAMDLTPDGRYLASAGGDSARLWDMSPIAGPREISRFVEDVGEVCSVQFSVDGKWLITGNTDGTIRKWPALNGQEIARLEHADRVNTLAFSPDGRWLATASDDQTVRVFKVNDWTPVEIPKLAMKHPTPIAAIAYSPNGRWLVTVSDNIVRLFDQETLRNIAILEHKNVVDEIGFSADGNFIMTRTIRTASDRAVSLRAGSIRVWSAQNFQELASRVDAKVNTTEDPAETSSVLSADQTAMLSNSTSWPKFSVADSRMRQYSPKLRSPDGRWIVSLTQFESPELSLAEFANPDREANKFRHDAKVTDVAFSVDSRWLASASEDHTVRIWPLKAEDLIEQACARLSRNLSREEWKDYMSDEPYSPTCPKLPVPDK
jgi:WD40 repeat protein